MFLYAFQAMENKIFETEFNIRFRNRGLKISSAASGNDFVISNDEGTKALLVRTVLPATDPDNLMHLHEPAPFYNAEAVLFFRFSISDSVYPPDHVVLIYENPALKRSDFLIFKTAGLEKRLGDMQIKPDRSGFYKLLLWIFPGDFIFAANDISGEGEWYLLGGLSSGGGADRTMAKGSERDFSAHLNRWKDIS